MQDIWHYARPDDAQRIVQTLDLGLVSALAIIEPRRRGKTTFLQDDLVPAAQTHGYLPIYINLAGSSGPLEPYLAATLHGAVAQASGMLDRLKRVGRSRVKKIAGKASATSIEIGGELELQEPAPGGLAGAIGELVALQRPVLLMLDEVHKLGGAAANDLAWSLRSLLDTQRKTIKVVATSSSAASYEVLVTGEKRAFNRWFTRVPLTPLGPDFIAHLADTTKRHFPKHAITQVELAEAFKALGDSPKFIRDYLNARILNPTVPHAPALQGAAVEAAKDSGFEDAFVRLTPLQKIVLVAIASGQKELFSADALKASGSVLKSEPVAKGVMQKAVRALADQGWVIRQDRGDYVLTDSLFEQWLSQQVRAGALPSPGTARPQ